MFSLVKFDNNERQVVPTKHITIGKDKKYVVNWRGSKYLAVLLKTHDSKESLQKKTGKGHARKQRKALRRVEPKDTLHINKAQNSSDIKIISNIVISDTNTEEKQNNCIPLLADCDSCYNIDDLAMAQLIEKYELNKTGNEDNITDIGAVCNDLLPDDSEIKAVIVAGCENLLPTDPELDVEACDQCEDLPFIHPKIETEIHTSVRDDDLTPIDPDKEDVIEAGCHDLLPVDPEIKSKIYLGAVRDNLLPVVSEIKSEIGAGYENLLPVDPEIEAEIQREGSTSVYPEIKTKISARCDDIPPIDLDTEDEIGARCFDLLPVNLEMNSKIYLDAVCGNLLSVDSEMKTEIGAGCGNLLPVDPEIQVEVQSEDTTSVYPEIKTKIRPRRDELNPIDPDEEYEIGASVFETKNVEDKIEATMWHRNTTSSDGNLSTTLTNANDSSFVPDQTTISYNDFSLTSQKSEITNECEPVDVRKISVPQSKNSDKRTPKKYFCPYCNKLQTKFARHLELMHKIEIDVQKFLILPKGNAERKKIIETIRKNGNYIHNTQPEHNTGILITCRQQVKNLNSAEDYVCCKYCKGFFSKRTLRLHYSTCSNQQYKKGTKQMMVMGRKLAGFIHPRANATLRRKVFPVLRDDQISRLIKYDQLIILFGNKLCEKYTLEHQHDMIRSNLRLLGRFLMALREKEKDITDLSSVFQPKFFDMVLEGIKTCASYNFEKGMFEAPSVATTIGTLLKKCLKMHMAECIKTQNATAKMAAENFLILFEEDIPTTINRKVLEDQQKHKSNKAVQLPTKSDISCLYTFLKTKMLETYEILEKRFDLAAYNTLKETTLVLLQTFNRRRAGEIERLLISDYNNQETIDDNAYSDLYDNVSPESRKHAKKFIRITIRGKLGRVVPVLLDTFIVKCIEMILAYRRKAGISTQHEYVFAVAGRGVHQKKYLRACSLMRKFSEECGAKKPTTLRGTTLRKHVATHTAMQGMEEQQVSDLANFMGHHKDIHKNVYRVPVPLRDLANVSRILQNAMGDDEENNTVDKNKMDSEINVVKKSLKRNQRVVSNDLLSDSWETKDTEVGQETESESSAENSKDESTHRRSTSPFGKTKRIRWNDEEKSAITDCFGDPTKCTKLPSLTQCFEAIKKYKALKTRTPQQIKTWIDNQRKAKTRLQAYKLRCTKS